MTDTPRKDGPRTEDLEWLVWYARKQKGTVAEVTRRALDENPGLRSGGWDAEAAAGPRDQHGWSAEDYERLAAAGPRDDGLHHHDVPGVGALWWDADGKIVAGPEDD